MHAEDEEEEEGACSRQERQPASICTHFTCFTSTEVQILTGEGARVAVRSVSLPQVSVFVLILLSLLVPKYKY
jgi:hypothetical protein